MSGKKGLFLVAGALAGFVAGLCLAPKEGSEIRKEAKDTLNYFKKEGYKVYFEKNISCYIDAKNNDDLKNKIEDKNFIKKEIDLVVEKDNKKYAIELKYPRNGEQTRELGYFVDDMLFMHQAFETKKFIATYCMTWVDDKRFYEKTENKRGRKLKDKYYYDKFRTYEEKNTKRIEKSICKNIGKYKEKRENFEITIKWNNINRGATKRFFEEKLPLKYYFVEIDSKN